MFVFGCVRMSAYPAPWPRCQYPCLPFLFSPCYHHDNLLTPVQRHTENISLPSPSHMLILLTPSPHLPHSHLSELYSLYLHLLSPESQSFALSISCSLQFPFSVYMLPTLKRVPLPDCHLCRESVICAALSLSLQFSILCPPADCLSLFITVKKKKKKSSPSSLPELSHPLPSRFLLTHRKLPMELCPPSVLHYIFITLTKPRWYTTQL